jgi:hypothetical protein
MAPTGPDGKAQGNALGATDIPSFFQALKGRNTGMLQSPTQNGVAPLQGFRFGW